MVERVLSGKLPMQHIWWACPNGKLPIKRFSHSFSKPSKRDIVPEQSNTWDVTNKRTCGLNH